MHDGGLSMMQEAAASVSSDILMSAQGIGFARKGLSLLTEIDLEIRQGRCLVVLGANGAGKSLLLRVMHGLLEPSSGSLTWQGRPIGQAERDLQAMVFQRPVMMRRSVRANLAFALRARRIRYRRRREIEMAALERASLDHLAECPARLLSGGEQQRLAIVRARVCEPKLLFMDEPTASLDPASTDAIERLVQEARSDGVAIVLVTHDPGQARRLGDDAVFLHQGRVAEAGSARQILDAPSTGPAQAWIERRLYLGADW